MARLKEYLKTTSFHIQTGAERRMTIVIGAVEQDGAERRMTIVIGAVGGVHVVNTEGEEL